VSVFEGLSESAPRRSWYAAGKVNEEEGDGHEERGWIHPSNRYHPFGDTDNGFATHGSWATQNMDKVERATPEAIGSTTLDTLSGMLRHGWIRKTYTNQYHIGRHEDLPRVMRHIQKHHPEHERVHVIVGAKMECDAEHYRFPVEPQRASQRRAASQAGWKDYLARHRVTHTMEPLNQAGTHSLKPWEERDHDQHSHSTAGGHYGGRAHRELERSHRLGRSEADNESMSNPPTSIQWGDNNWMKRREHAWIAPDGTYHKLKSHEHHADATGELGGEKAAYFNSDRYDDIHSMLKKGWVRKVDKAIYHIDGGPADLHISKHTQRVFDHVDDYHPDVNRISINYGNRGMDMRFFNRSKSTGKFELDPRLGRSEADNESRADQLIRVVLESMSDPPTSIQWGDNNWMKRREHAWIAPEGTYHKLKPHEHHADATGELGGESYDIHSMLKKGWVRKADKAIYHIDGNSARPHESKHIQRVFDHVDDYHPDVNRISINYGNQGINMRFFNRSKSTGKFELEP
jgi:hypothetical protein